MPKLAFAVVVLALMSGCFKRIPDVMKDSPNVTLKAVPDKAVVVFVRPSAWPAGYYPVVMDESGKFLGDLHGASYFSAEVTPGKHDFVTFMESAELVHADCAAGKVYVIEVFGAPGAFNPRFYMSASVKGGDKWPYPKSELKDLTPTAPENAAEAQQALVDSGKNVDKLAEAKDNFAELKGDDLRHHTINPDDGFDGI